MVKRLIVVLDDEDVSSTEHYVDILAEELEKLLSSRFKLVSVNEKGGPNEPPKR